MGDLKRFRAAIDEIDVELADLFERRMKVSREIAAYKIAQQLPVLNEEREAEVLQKSLLLLEDLELKEELQEFFATVMRLSRVVQIKEFTKSSLKGKCD